MSTIYRRVVGSLWVCLCLWVCGFVCGFDTLLIFTLVFGFNLCLMEGRFPVKIVEGGG